MANDPELTVLTNILRARLAYKSIIDCRILDRSEFYSINNVNDQEGRYLGFFTRRPSGDICFFVFIRSDSAGSFDHVVGYYVNKKFFKIPKSEINCFKRMATPGSKTSMQNVQTGAHRLFYPSILIQMIIFTLDMSLVTDFKRYRLLKAGGSDLFLCFNPMIGLPNCQPNQPDPDAKFTLDIIRSRGFKTLLFHCDRPSSIDSDVDLLIIFYKSHLVFGIHYQPHRLLNILLPHVNQFRDQATVLELKCILSKAFGQYQLQNIVASRLYSTENVHCSSGLIMKACALALHHPFVSIRDCELNAIIELLQLEEPSSMPSQLSIEPSIQSEIIEEEDSQPSDLPTIEATVAQEDGFGMVSLDCGNDEPPELPIQTKDTSSQDTVILGEDEVQFHVAFMKLRRRARDTLTSRYPEDNKIKARNDADGKILQSPDLYLDLLVQIVDTLLAYTTATIIDPTELEDFDKEVSRTDRRPCRFLVWPLIVYDTDALIVIDREKEEWGYLNPDNLAWRNKKLFETIESMIKSSSSLLASYEGAPINMTSYYHRGYPKMHLLMALFHISKSFWYASLLPRKVIYREKDFRDFCNQLLSELSIANAVYNHKNNLVKKNLMLTQGAYISRSTLVPFERAVVTEDQCVFCKSRTKVNVGSHMSMYHGEYGSKNRGRRRWRESLEL